MTARSAWDSRRRMGSCRRSGSMNSMDSFGTTLTGSHPFSLVLPMKDAPNLVASLVAQGKTADPTGAVKLVAAISSARAVTIRTCRGSTRSRRIFWCATARTRRCAWPVTIRTGWCRDRSIRWRDIREVFIRRRPTRSRRTRHVGSYPTVGVNACNSCHMSHDAVAPARLLRPATPGGAGKRSGDAGLHDVS